MDKHQLEFIEESGLVFESFGMTRMSGRIFGYLLVCDRDAVSFSEIKEVLKASKGSISGTTRQLINAGLVNQVSLPGDRKTYFRPAKDNVGKILKERINLFSKFAVTLEKGRKLKKREDDISDWLLEMSTFYNWIGGQIETIIDRWENEKEEIIKKRLNHENDEKKE